MKELSYTTIEQDLLDRLINDMRHLSNEFKPMTEEEIRKAQKILCKKFKILNIKTKDIEKITIKNCLNVVEKLFQGEFYQYGVYVIILVWRKKNEFKIKKTSINILERIKQWYDIDLIKFWPYSDSLFLKIIKPILTFN